MEISKAEIKQFQETQKVRYELKIMPTEHDREWFEKNTRRAFRHGGRRVFHVRPAVAFDHYAFCLAGNPVDDFITIVDRDCRKYVLGRAEGRFGPVVDSDEYAYLRIDALSKEYRTEAWRDGAFKQPVAA
jgi:hypothetical protein